MSERYPGEEAERAMLGMMLISEGALGIGLEVLQAHHFHDEGHRTLFQAIADTDKAGIAVDTISVMEMGRASLDKHGGFSLILEVTDHQAVANVRHTANVVRERAVNRRLIRIGQMISAIASDDLKVEERDAKIDRLLATMYETTAEGEEPALSEGIAAALRETRALADGQGYGVPTGYNDLDAILGGCKPGQLIILASRPGMGKTALGVNIGQNIAERNDPVLIFSIEMPTPELAGRMLSRQSQVGFEKMRVGARALTDEEWARLEQAAGVISAQPLYVDDRPPYTMASLRARARRAVRTKGIKLVIVDYLQLLATDHRGENRQVEVAEISRGLKMLARELEVPVIAMAQLSRAVEKRDDKRPNLSDLRDSGALEQDADIVIFPWREGYYEPESEQRAELIVAKHRNGRLGIVYCLWKAATVEFVNAHGRRRTDTADEGIPWQA
jgi:replicative DNA helicase